MIFRKPILMLILTGAVMTAVVPAHAVCPNGYESCGERNQLCCPR